MKVGIIGAGASGILCAIQLKKKYGDKIIVDLYEQEDKIGKKILQTGNGKCNFANANLNESFYNDSGFVKDILNRYNLDSILETFTSLGILYKMDEEGRYYPLSENAASFLEVLKYHLNILEVNTFVNTKITSIKQKNSIYVINDDKEYDRVIISIGGKARVKEYDNSFLDDLNIEVTDDHPGLVSVKVKEKFLKNISGIRLKVNAQVINNNQVCYQNEGEVLFKDDSLSGIVLFSCSRYIDSKSIIELDLIKDYDETKMLSWMEMLEEKMLVKDAFLSLFPRLLAITLSKELNLVDKTIGQLSIKERKKLINKLKHFQFHVDCLNDYNNAQIMCGGIDLKQVNEKLQLKTHPSIYVMGEVLNIDGECGGFNLSFAWACALCVADNIKL